MKDIIIMLVLILIHTVLSAQVAIAPEGNGSAANPYQIATLENLYWVSQNGSCWNAQFSQTANIDASETATWFPNGSGGYYGWMPIGNDTVSFTGFYHGHGYAIKGLYSNRPNQDYVGFFGKCRFTQASDGQVMIRNLTLVDADITGHEHVGALTGYIRGWNDSYILYRPCVYLCHSIANVTGWKHVGGLIGYEARCYLSYSSSSGSVFGDYYVGGLVGTLSDHCEIIKSYSSAQVANGNRMGGLVAQINDYAYLRYCYSSGQVVGGSWSGGLVGFVSDSDHTSNAIDCFWDIGSSGINTSAKGTGKTTAQMKQRSTYPASGWLFEGDTIEWWMIEGQTRPILRNEYSANIRTPHQLQMMSIFPDADYQLIWDIDLAGTQNAAEMWATGLNAEGGFSPIGTNEVPFTGTLDGNGHQINNIHICRSLLYYQSLMGVMAGSELIKLHIVDAFVKGDAYTAGVSGKMVSGASLINCSFDGQIQASGNYTGGLAGDLDNSSIQYCHSKGTLNAASYSGGLVGFCENGAVVSDSFSHMNVYASAHVGGFIGSSSNDTITDCYCSGIVSGTSSDVGGFFGSKPNGETNSCFWDTETSGWDYSAGGEAVQGKSTAEMTDPDTFINAGWNFTSVWDQDAALNDGYPYLIWQEIVAPPEAPQNVFISISDNEVTIAWDIVDGAASYHVYSSDDPYANFELDDSGVFTDNSWTAPATTIRAFYHVIAAGTE
ncbi:MAG: hypothetical protein PHR59_04630 [Candidatus Cloacimonetes bacterium]|nr:hypothetical protein [Candidatus Cloacimonadota bacterium]